MDREEYKEACTTLRNARRYLDDTETALRNHPPDILMPPNVFETCVGQFWGLVDTRD